MPRFSKNHELFHRFFSGIGVAFVVMTFILGFSVLIILGAGALRSWLENELARQFFANLRTQETIQNIKIGSEDVEAPVSIQFGPKPEEQPVIRQPADEPLAPSPAFPRPSPAGSDL